MGRITAGTVIAAALAGIPSAIYGPATAAPARTLVVTAYEYSFQAPDSVPAGIVTVRLVDRGRKGHQLAMARLDDTSSLDRVMRSLIADKARTGGLRWVGGVESAIPGQSAETILPLTSGRYVIICAYDGDNGLAHMSLGMIRPLIVTPGTPVTAQSLPSTPTTIELSDYHIDISEPLHSGTQLVRVVNAGKQRHRSRHGANRRQRDHRRDHEVGRQEPARATRGHERWRSRHGSRAIERDRTGSKARPLRARLHPRRR